MKYINYKWWEGIFNYYDKASGETKPFTFTEMEIDEVGYRVKGWDDESWAIFSNVITSFKEGENLLKVQVKGKTLYEGPYNKAAIEATGGKIHIEIVWNVDGEDITLALKGTNFFRLSEALKTFDRNKNKLKFVWVEDAKKGAVKYKIPLFEKGSEYVKSKGETPDGFVSIEDLPFN